MGIAYMNLPDFQIAPDRIRIGKQLLMIPVHLEQPILPVLSSPGRAPDDHFFSTLVTSMCFVEQSFSVLLRPLKETVTIHDMGRYMRGGQHKRHTSLAL